MKTSLAAIMLSNLFVALAGIGATPEEYFGPLTSVDQVSVRVSFDCDLGIELQQGTPLIEVDSDRAAQFERTLLAAACERFQQGGIAVSEASSNVVMFCVVGGSFHTSKGKATRAYLVQSEVCLADDNGCVVTRAVLGVSDESRLQDRLVEATVRIVNDFVDGKARWQQSRKPR